MQTCFVKLTNTISTVGLTLKSDSCASRPQTLLENFFLHLALKIAFVVTYTVAKILSEPCAKAFCRGGVDVTLLMRCWDPKFSFPMLLIKLDHSTRYTKRYRWNSCALFGRKCSQYEADFLLPMTSQSRRLNGLWRRGWRKTSLQFDLLRFIRNLYRLRGCMVEGHYSTINLIAICQTLMLESKMAFGWTTLVNKF